MRNSDKININSILKDNSSVLSKLTTKASEIHSIWQKLVKHIPSDIVKHCCFHRYKNGNITISVPSATWQTQLRYHIPEILNSVRKQENLYQIRSIDVINDPSLAITQHKRKKANKNPISNDSAKSIKQAAETIKDPKLREALLKLSRKDN